MTAEAPGKRPEIPRFSDGPLNISPETAIAAARVARKVSKNEAPDPNDLKELTVSVGHDLMREGLVAGKDDY